MGLRKKRLMFGIRPYSNLWHATWMNIVFLILITIWILEIIWGFQSTLGDEEPTSYGEDFLSLVPVGTIIFAFLAVGSWIAWWRGGRGRGIEEPKPKTLEELEDLHKFRLR